MEIGLSIKNGLVARVMPTADRLSGLRLTRSERFILVALSYLFCAPVFYNKGKLILRYWFATSAAARRSIRDEANNRRRGRD